MNDNAAAHTADAVGRCYNALPINARSLRTSQRETLKHDSKRVWFPCLLSVDPSGGNIY
jgi:hypothetical protein